MKRKGVSLIVLVITIVVIIILAATLVLALNQNNPIQTSRVATISQTRDNLQSAVVVYLGNVHTKTLGDYSAEELLIQNDSYKIVEETAVDNKITIQKDGNNINLYKLDTGKVKSSLSIEIKNGEKDAWYIDNTGKIYLVYESLRYVPEYYMEYGAISSTLSDFLVCEKKLINSFVESIVLSSNGTFGAKVRSIMSNIKFDAELEYEGYVAEDTILNINSSKQEVLSTLNLDSNVPSLKIRKVSKTMNLGDEVSVWRSGYNFQEKGNGFYFRKYIILKDGKIIYDEPLYYSLINLNLKYNRISDDKINLELSRDVIEQLNETTPMTVTSAGIIYVKDGVTLAENSTVEEANNVLVIDSTNSSVIKEVDSSTANKNTFTKEITDDGNGVWARGYVTLSYGEYTKTMYTDAKYISE